MILVLDCSAGASGDMLLAAMLELGLPLEEVRGVLRRLGLDGAQVRAERVRAGGGAARRVRVSAPAGAAPPRGAAEVLRVIRRSALAPSLRRDVARVFTLLARAEGAEHSVPPGKVRFHQLAGADTLASVAGFCAGVRRLKVRAVHATPVPVGEWHVSHQGRWVRRPGPATTRLLRRFPTTRGPGRFEWTTPTAAALLAAFGSPAAPPPLRVERIGRGVGHLRPPSGPGVLTALLGHPLG